MKYRVKNWQRFQHYRDRNPPWIKLHFEMLASETWVMLDDASRVLAVACMLIASRNEGLIDGSDAGLAYLRRVAYLHKKPNLEPLITNGFLESASDTLADASAAQADARPEREAEAEAEAEGEAKAETEAETDAQAPGLDLDVWRRWLEYRKAIGKPLRKQSLEAAAKALAAYGSVQAAVVEQSIANGWQGLFPLKSAGPKPPPARRNSGIPMHGEVAD